MQPTAWSAALFFFLFFVCLPAACAGLVAVTPSSQGLPASSSRLSDFLSAAVLFLLASGGLSALANSLMGLVASALAATLIARDRETQTWPLLRLTTLTPGQIVGGKLAAFFNILKSSMHLVALWRVLTIAGALGGGVLFVLTSPDLQSALDELRAAVPPEAGLTLAGVGLIGLMAVAYWLIEPYFTVAYSGALGLAVSTFARTRRWAIALVFITQFALALALYWPVQQVAALLPFAVVALLNQISPAANFDLTVLTVPMIGLQYVVVVLLQAAVLAICLAIAVYRAGRLTD